MNFLKIKHFLLIRMWQTADGEMAKPVRWIYNILRKIFLSVRFFVGRGHIDYATALSFSTLLAIVPIFAAIFAIGKGFGLAVYIENWLRELMSSQPQVAETVINMAGSYLNHAKSGVIIGIGLVFMLYSIISLIYNIEHAFNEIWQVKEKRSGLRIITDYTALILLVPIAIILISGINIFVYTIADHLEAFVVLGWLLKLVIKLLPLVVMTLTFTAMYVFIPNTKVHVRAAIGPAFIASVCMLALQFFYIHCQIFLTSYNAIYGSFAALPLFMLWVMVSWYICLFCGELCYTNQNMEYYAFLIRTEDVSHNDILLMCTVLLNVICKRIAQGKKPLTALQLKQETDIPIRITTDLLYRLKEANLVSENSGTDGSDHEPTYQPAQDIANITAGKLVEVIESQPRSRHRRLNKKIREHIQSETLSRINTLRQQYIKDLKGVRL
jgi:membrane protein